MIISASRRTDIPAFFGTWFIKRVQEGFAMYRNPVRPSQVFVISLEPQDVDAIVFWTKNPMPFLDKLNYLNDYVYYFQFTLNAYDKSLELHLPPKERLVETFIELSQRIGKDRVIWRYDPIILTNKITISYHEENFEKLAEKLSHWTTKCIVSYVEFYSKVESALKKIGAKKLTDDEILKVFEKLAKIAAKYELCVEVCAEEADIEAIGLKKAHCIDGELIRILRQKKGLDSSKVFQKDKNQRTACGCVQSADIGYFNTCQHFCIYCYAKHGRGHIVDSIKMYDVNFPLLCSRIDWENDEIRIRIEDKSFKLEKEEILSGSNKKDRRGLFFWKDEIEEKKMRLISKIKRFLRSSF